MAARNAWLNHQAMQRLKRSTAALPQALAARVVGRSQASVPGVPGGSWLGSMPFLSIQRASVGASTAARAAVAGGAVDAPSRRFESARRDHPLVGRPARGIAARGRHDGARQIGTMRELEDSVDLLREGRGDELRAKMARDGYVLLRGLLDREKVLALRGEVVSELKDLAWLDPTEQSDARLGTLCARPPAETLEGGKDPHDWPIFDRVQRLAAFHALPHSPPLLHAIDALCGEEALLHPRHILRAHFPNQPIHRTLPHQDYPYVQGTARALTCWCPLGDVPVSFGPLAILVGSNRAGPLKVISEPGGALMVDFASLLDDCHWASTHFSAGDVLIFTALTCHMGLDNESDEVRLSLDCRASPRSLPVSHRSLEPNWARDTWEEIYAHPSWAVPGEVGGGDAARAEEEGGRHPDRRAPPQDAALPPPEAIKHYWQRGVPVEVMKEAEFQAVSFHAAFDPFQY